MVFSSNIFLFAFLPAFLLAYYATPLRWRSVTILLGSYLFYAWWRVDFVFLFMAVTLWNYLISKKIVAREGTTASRRWMITGVIGNLSTLGYFKYFNFGADSLNTLLGYGGADPFSVWNVILPIGISFYIFQAVSFLIDVYRKDAPPARHFFDFAAFIGLFPQLIAGPVLRYKDLADQFEHREHSFDRFSEGAYRFMIGFCKKVLIADTIAPLVDLCFAQENPSFADAWLGTLAYTIQLYFDFSGYSHMAIGLGLMMGFRFIENFNHPYIARSITEFWSRWHISLSTWLRDYLYIPLGGNRKGSKRTTINLMLTMVLGGLWHGANWTFVLWGFWHGSIMAIERALGIKDRDLKAWSTMRHITFMAFTILLVMIGWIMFRAPDVATAFAFYEGMLGMNGWHLSENLAWQVKDMALAALALGVAIVYLSPWLQYKKNIKLQGKDLASSPSIATQGVLIGLFILAVMKLSAEAYSPFLYFQF